MKISAIVCTHNPRPHYLRRVLEALNKQTLDQSQWELLLIDNASREPLKAGAVKGGKVARSEGNKAESWLELGWHAQARVIREDKVGLTHARLRGIDEAKGELIVFIDDDNVLAPDYFDRCLTISASWPQLGVWGGSVAGEFEVPPPEWIKRFLAGMVVYEIDRDYWSNMAVWSSAIPFGAGMCVRRHLARSYAEGVKNDPLRQQLGRTGKSMTASEDVDLAYTVIGKGFGTARFKDLKITHLIPKERLTEDYVVRLFSGFEVSGFAMARIRGEKRSALYGDLRSELRFWKKYLEASPIDRKIMMAARKQMKEIARSEAAATRHE